MNSRTSAGLSALCTIGLTLGALGCGAGTVPLAKDGGGHVAFGTVFRTWELASAGQQRLEAQARALCGGKGRYGISFYSPAPPGEAPALAFTAEPSVNLFRQDHAEYAVVACRGDIPAEKLAGIPTARLLHAYESVEPDRPAVDAAAVRFVQSSRAEDLPPCAVRALEGSFQPPYARESMKVTLDKDVPTAADPDRWLGMFELGPLSDDDEARVVAAQHGANLVVRPDKARHFYLAFYVSSTFPTTSEAIAQLGLPGSYKRVGNATQVELSEEKALTFEAKAGQCYTFVGALDREAVLNERGLRIVRSWEGRLGTYWADDLPSFKGTARAFSTSFGCPNVSGTIGVNVEWSNRIGSGLARDVKRASRKGSWELAVYARPVTAAEREALEMSRKQEVCRACENDRLACLRSAGVSEAECTTLLRSARPSNVGGLILDGTR